MAYKKPLSGKGSTYGQRYGRLPEPEKTAPDPKDLPVRVPVSPQEIPTDHLIDPTMTRPAWRTDRPQEVPARDQAWALNRYKEERIPSAPTRSIYQFVSDAFYRMTNGWVG